MASKCGLNRKLGGLLVCLAALGLGCDDDNSADHDAAHGDHDHGASGSPSVSAGASGEHAAHGDAEHSHDPNTMVGPLTGAICPSSGSTLTYNNFAKQFFAAYCLSCHAEKVTGAARMGAPADHNFDTYADIDLLRMHIDQLAGSGPSATNVKMPPAAATKKPTMEERQKLSEWIACGDPE
jgi:hypothetical protein